MALQLRNLQSLVEIGVDKNTTVVFPAPLMTTIAELGSFLAREKAAATVPIPVADTNGTPAPIQQVPLHEEQTASPNLADLLNGG